MNRKQRCLHRLRNAGRRACRYCGTKQRNMLTLEHLTPLSRGGTWEASNLDVSCYRCNLSKGKLTDAEFKALGPVVRWTEKSGQLAENFARRRKIQRRAAAKAAGNQPVAKVKNMNKAPTTRSGG